MYPGSQLLPYFAVRLVHADDQPFAPLFDHILGIAVFRKAVESSAAFLSVDRRDHHFHFSLELDLAKREHSPKERQYVHLIVIFPSRENHQL